MAVSVAVCLAATTMASLPATTAASLPPAYAQAETAWRPFYDRVQSGSAALIPLGKPDEETGIFDGGKELFWRHPPRFPGGVSIWIDSKDRCIDATFYLAPVGPVWTAASKRAASNARSPVTLDTLAGHYGKPDHDIAGKGRRVGVRRLIYEEGGEATRSVVFFSLPYSPRLHYLRVSHELP